MPFYASMTATPGCATSLNMTGKNKGIKEDANSSRIKIAFRVLGDVRGFMRSKRAIGQAGSYVFGPSLDWLSDYGSDRGISSIVAFINPNTDFPL